MPKKKRKRPVIERAPLHIPNFGCVNELRFTNGGSAIVQMNSNEIVKFMEALETYELRSRKLPRPDVLAALDLLKRSFDLTSQIGSQVCLTAEMVIAANGVRLEPIFPQDDEPSAPWRAIGDSTESKNDGWK